MAYIIDAIMRNLPIFLLCFIFICLIYCELSELTINGGTVMEILHGVIVGDRVETL